MCLSLHCNHTWLLLSLKAQLSLKLRKDHFQNFLTEGGLLFIPYLSTQ